jgi:predicted transcriptional regulator
MDDIPHRTEAAPAGWLEILAESEAEAEAGLFVDGDEIMRELDETIARMEAERAARPPQKAAARR